MLARDRTIGLVGGMVDKHGIVSQSRRELSGSEGSREGELAFAFERVAEHEDEEEQHRQREPIRHGVGLDDVARHFGSHEARVP